MTTSIPALQPTRRTMIAAALGLGMLAGLPGVASAEGLIRIAEQFGVGYLPLQVMRDQSLIEKRGFDRRHLSG